MERECEWEKGRSSERGEREEIERERWREEWRKGERESEREVA